MEEKLVSYKVAVLAEEAGFNWPCSRAYYVNDNNNCYGHITGRIYNFKDERIKLALLCEEGYEYEGLSSIKNDFTDKNYWKKEFNNSDHLFYISAPTQSLLQKYLRGVHNIHIEILYIDDILQFQAEICTMNNNTIVSDTKCGNYEDVLEEALEIALNLIKDDNNRK